MATLPTQSSRRPNPVRVRSTWWIYLTLLPTLAFLAIMAYYPAASGIWHSFFDWNPGFVSEFTGLENYRRLLGDELWWDSFAHLGIIFLASITVMWVIPLAAAELVITLRSMRAQHVFRTLLIVPLAFPGVVTALIWSFMYHPNDGVINRLLEALGLGSLAQNWVGDPDTALIALICVGFPWIAGLPFLVFFTALQNIPSEIFEAASLDGAGRLRRIWSIDLPMMFRQVKLLLFLALIMTMQYGFAAYLVTSGGPDNATSVPVLRMLGAAFSGQDWGYAAAMSTMLFGLAVVISGAAALAQRRGRNVRSI